MTAPVVGAVMLLLLAAAPDRFDYTLEITPEEGPVDHAIEARHTRALAACQHKARITNDSAVCLVAEFPRQDAALNRQWAKAMARTPAAERTALRVAQRRWAADRDPFCDAVYKSFAGGTIAPVAYADCRVELTIRRTLWLERLGR